MAISKKLVTAIITGLLIVFQKNVGLDMDSDQLNTLAATVVGYLFSQSVVDRKLVEKGLKGHKEEAQG